MTSLALRSLSYSLTGEGTCVVFLHALGTSRAMWKDQSPAQGCRWLSLAPDMRGHGESAPARDGDYSFDALANDVITLLDHHGIRSASVVGISVGGEIAQVLAALHPDRVERLLLVSTACVTREERAVLWGERIAEAQAEGMQGVAQSAVRRWFTQSYQRENSETVAHWQRIAANTSLEGYIGIARTIQRMDLRPMLATITCPTLVLSGELDTATGSATGEEIASLVPGARHCVMSGAGHLWNLESPAAFNAELAGFLSAV